MDAGKKISRYLIGAGFIGVVFWAGFFLFKEDDLLVNLALKKGSNTYLFSMLGSKNTEVMIKNGQDIVVMKTTSIIELDDELYVEVNGLENIVSLISGYYKTHKKEKKLYNGYVSKDDDSNFFSQKIATEDGEKIGEFVYKKLIQLKNGSNSFEIKWSYSPEKEAEKNCIVTSIWVDSGVPGENTTVSRDVVVVKIKDVISFYDNRVKIEYNKDDHILYVVE